jgi:oxygen-independent coproporphyrinogen III oxidase
MNANIDPLAIKYNQPVPRYTSYPTVPFWKDGLDVNRWKELLQQQSAIHNHKEGISIYIHLPFCESLCTYCGCNKKITTNHSVEDEYLLMIEKEFSMYLGLLKDKPVIREIHLGGGTPTFFSPVNLGRLINFIKGHSAVHSQHEFSIEGHPNNTTRDHLQSLYDLGFRRISYGVQDNDPDVQRIINRIQPLENVKRATDKAREIGFESVNYDLIYGLPKQTLQSITRTFEQVLELKPDRIAFYSYAHVPWTSRGQRLFDEDDLPSPEEKLQLYLKGKEILTHAGYVDIGMDHFALTNDSLYKAMQNGTLHRNFMGYTTQHTSVLLGLGVSSISDVGIGFAQNTKALHEYYECIRKNKLPVFRGFFLNEEDVAFRKYILNISCQGKTKFDPSHLEMLNEITFSELRKLEEDQLIVWNQEGLTVTALGRHFIRNICAAFDLHFQRNKEVKSKPLFSKAI